ncbi:MAG: bifunctional diaminohydroxyphosphoribosylaminopyrimidine deaminase/5-amino-6-(5-phosphoribosylamino)uracil reductase RibD [Flavitalea sp.]
MFGFLDGHKTNLIDFGFILLAIAIQKITMEIKEIYMQRCIDLAKNGAGSVAPNPMVGAVLVYQDRIIGEGFHQVYGGPHAEVNCILSVSDSDRALIPLSTLYVSLEPCAHFGKTPPCTNLILSEKIQNVIIGSKDPFNQVNGKGIDILKKGGVNVIQGILEKECDNLNKRFFTFHKKHRPYIILKWAQTANAKISSEGPERLLISNKFTDRLVHRWRSEESGIMVGTNTASNDDPILTNRWWTGNSPVRIVIDRNLKLSQSLNLFDGSTSTIIFHCEKREESESDPVNFIPLRNEPNLLPQILQSLFELKILSVIVEGGAGLINSFISSGVWDEARVITNASLVLQESESGEGLAAPQLIDAHLQDTINIGFDQVQTFIHINSR